MVEPATCGLVCTAYKTGGETYGTVDHVIPGISAFLDVTLQRNRVKWLQEFKTTE